MQAHHVEAWKRARGLAKKRQRQEAAKAFHDLCECMPEHPAVLYEAGLAAYEVRDYDLARKRFLQAMPLTAGDAKLQCLIGRSLARMGQLDHARTCWNRAMATNPSDVEPLHDMVKQWEREGELGMARECLDGFLKKHPHHPVAQYLDAFLHFRSGELPQAESLLRRLVTGPVFHTRRFLTCHYLLADLLDQTERDDEAMELLAQVKQAVLQNPDFETTLQHYDRGVGERKALLQGFTPQIIEQWQSQAPFAPDDARVAFLGGHPRSGTTLLERILDSHPEITAFDEPTAFYRSIEPFLGRYGPNHPGISEITAEYRRQLLWPLGGRCDSRVWLDKNPSLTACLHSWLRTFPGIKVVIALRHPLDVMLSCYFLDSTMNSLSANFLSFERISKHYRDMMDVWLRLRELGGFSWMESRYEDTVSDLQGEGRRVTEFLGLAWHPEQSQFHQLKQKTALSAPTYHEVTQPIHAKSLARWKRYEKHLQPHIDALMPYAEKLGYC